MKVTGFAYLCRQKVIQYGEYSQKRQMLSFVLGKVHVSYRQFNVNIVKKRCLLSLKHCQYCISYNTYCIKKVIVLWNALAHLIFNLHKSFLRSRKDQALSCRLTLFCDI